MAQASRALVMLLPTPPLPDTTPITFLTLLLGLGASCCGPCRLGQSSPQLEQSWVHSSLILLFPAPKGGAASCSESFAARVVSPRGLLFMIPQKNARYKATYNKAAAPEGTTEQAHFFQYGFRIA